jgi:gluconolactonase
MFPAPPVIETRVFARLPDSFRRPGTRTRWADVMTLGGTVDCFLEGPSFDAAGNLYVVDIPYGRVFRIDPDGAWTLVAEYDGEPNGLKFHADGRAYIADHKHGIMRLDVADGAVETVVDRPGLERFKGCNDLFFTRDGALLFTDQGQTGLHDPSGRLYRLSPDGRLERLLDAVPSPNGLVTNLEEKILYLAVTRDNAVWRVPMLADGRPTKVGCSCSSRAASPAPTGSRSTRTATSPSPMPGWARFGCSAGWASRSRA